MLLSFLPLIAETNSTKPILLKKPLYGYKSSNFSLRVITGIVTDYTFFKQDKPSLLQVGPQEDQFDFRAFRFGVGGKFSLLNEKFGYLFVCDASSYLDDEDSEFCSIMNMSLYYKIPDNKGVITIGKMKEPWSYEMVGDSVNLLHHERLLSPFFQSRNIGIRYNMNFAQQNATYAIGVYNNWLDSPESFDDNGYQVSSRLTGLPYISDDAMSYLHLGASLRYNVGTKGVLRYHGKAESSVTDYYVDTGDIEADHALEFGFEALWSHNGFSLLGEYMQTNVSSKKYDDPSFFGYYITTGWMITGESRPYDKRLGYARGISPKSDNGAFELIARYGEVDLNDKAIHGGQMRKWMLGMNWYIDPYWKTSVSYGTATLDNFDKTGKTDILLFRLQWIR